MRSLSPPHRFSPVSVHLRWAETRMRPMRTQLRVRMTRGRGEQSILPAGGSIFCGRKAHGSGKRFSGSEDEHLSTGYRQVGLAQTGLQLHDCQEHECTLGPHNRSTGRARSGRQSSLGSHCPAPVKAARSSSRRSSLRAMSFPPAHRAWSLACAGDGRASDALCSA